MKLALALTCALVFIPSASASDYHYFSLRTGTSHGVVKLISASVGVSSHAAAWYGVTNNNRSWVQAGIEQSDNTTGPELYIERKPLNGYPSLTTWNFTYGMPATVSIRHKGIYYWVRITTATESHRSRRVRIYTPSIMSVLEIWHSATAVAQIGSRLVNAST